MPGLLTALLKWGGSAATLVSVIAVVYVEVVAPPPEDSESGAPVTLYWVLIAGGPTHLGKRGFTSWKAEC